MLSRVSGKDGQPRTRQHRSVIPVLLAVIVLVSTDGAFAADSRRECDDASAADQYEECIPSSSGSKGRRGQRPGEGTGPIYALPETVGASLDQAGGDAAAVLKKISTSSAYGAAASRPDPAAKENMEALADTSVSPGAAFAAAASAVGAGQGRLVFVLVALVLVSIAMMGFAVRRHKRAQS